MTRSTRRRFGGLVGKLLFTCAALLIAWLVLRPPLIDIGGARLETRLKGSGSPTVVFETGFTGGILPYWKLQDRIAEHTRTLFYERAGLGRSDAGRQPRTAEQMARDLHSLLIAAGVTPPIILVGHSAGGIFMRVFAHDYPNDVAAMVFVDPATEASYERMRRASPEEWREMDKKLPEGQRRQWDALPASLDEARSAWPLPQIPYVVITAMKPSGEWGLKSPEDMVARAQEHRDLLAQLPGAMTTHIILPQADHFSVLKEPGVTKAILNAVDQARIQR